MTHGGSAFPAFEPIEQFDEETGRYREHMLPTAGMTLRDYFAAQFLATVQIHGNGVAADVIAKNCYAMADAMLKERDR